jgi:hypothetical protein
MKDICVNYKLDQFKQNCLNSVNLLLISFQNAYNEGVLVVEFRGAEALTTNVICSLIQEKKNIINENWQELPSFYAMELKRLQ